MSEQVFKVGDRVDFNANAYGLHPKRGGAMGAVVDVIVSRRYVVEWEDDPDERSPDPYEAKELIRLSQAGENDE